MNPFKKLRLDLELEETTAVPEVHTKKERVTEEETTEEITYDGVAFPEIHIRKLEHKE